VIAENTRKPAENNICQEGCVKNTLKACFSVHRIEIVSKKKIEKIKIPNMINQIKLDIFFLISDRFHLLFVGFLLGFWEGEVVLG
jgi:hypothetical protein